MRGEQSRGRATLSDRFFYRRCVVVVTQAEADFRFGLSPQGAQGEAAQLAKTGYHTGLIHSVQYLMEKSVCMVSEGHVEPVDG